MTPVCPESAFKAVEQARANGHKVYICTGCSKAEIEQRDLPELDGMIGANGGYVEDAGEVVMHHALTVEQVRHIVDWCNDGELGFYLEANSGMYINSRFEIQAPRRHVQVRHGQGRDRGGRKGCSRPGASPNHDPHRRLLPRRWSRASSFQLPEFT